MSRYVDIGRKKSLIFLNTNIIKNMTKIFICYFNCCVNYEFSSRSNRTRIRTQTRIRIRIKTRMNSSSVRILIRFGMIGGPFLNMRSTFKINILLTIISFSYSPCTSFDGIWIARTGTPLYPGDQFSCFLVRELTSTTS